MFFLNSNIFRSKCKYLYKILYTKLSAARSDSRRIGLLRFSLCQKLDEMRQLLSAEYLRTGNVQCGTHISERAVRCYRGCIHVALHGILSRYGSALRGPGAPLLVVRIAAIRLSVRSDLLGGSSDHLCRSRTYHAEEPVGLLISVRCSNGVEGRLYAHPGVIDARNTRGNLVTDNASLSAP